MKFQKGQSVRLPRWLEANARLGWVVDHTGEAFLSYWVVFPLRRGWIYNNWKNFSVPGPALLGKQFSLASFAEYELRLATESELSQGYNYKI